MRQNRTFARLRAILFDRTGQSLTLAAAALLISGIGMRGAWPVDFREAAYFDYQRLQWKSEADLVLIGDSRTMTGVSPGAMTESLPGLRIRNFAFGAAGYSDQYLDAAEAILDSRDGARVIVMGVTPRALRRVSLRDNGFARSRSSFSTYAAWKSSWGGAIQHYWHPVDRGRTGLLGKGGERAAAPVWHADGWLEPRTIRVNPAATLTYYGNLQRERIDAAIVEGLLRRVRQWTGQGIRVYGFRPPTCDAMRAVESDFDEDAFVQRFQQAGGLWLSPATAEMTTWDGSHLDHASALLLSRRLAGLIAGTEPLLASQTRPAPRRPR